MRLLLLFFGWEGESSDYGLLSCSVTPAAVGVGRRGGGLESHGVKVQSLRYAWKDTCVVERDIFLFQLWSLLCSIKTQGRLGRGLQLRERESYPYIRYEIVIHTTI